uniref:Uncharacterized protein n=1 Tax=Anguilla anguilla TaxID=7936 RepID=A0A0E9QIQ8_ANGAN
MVSCPLNHSDQVFFTTL